MNDERVNGTNKNWLIKSSARILGPFTLNEVVENIKSKQISIIDEVRQPDGRWSYIREISLFMDIVRSIREEQDPYSEKTMTQSLAHHTMTKTDSFSGSDDITLTPVPPEVNSGSLKDVTPVFESPMGAASTAKSYGASGDTRLKQKMQKKTHRLRWALLSLTFLVILGVGLSLLQKDKNRVMSYDELMAQAIRYKNLGLYEKSLLSYQRASKLKQPDAESQVQMAPVLISEDRQSLQGRRILESVLGQTGRSRSETVEAYLGIAVSYIMDGDLKQAEDILQKALGHEPYNLSALLNMAIIQHKKGNYAGAMRDFDLIQRKNPQSALALFGKALATLEYAKTRMDSSVLPALVRDIKAGTAKTGYLRQELTLVLVYAYSLLGDIDGLNQSVVQFLNQMPGQTKNYVHPLHVEWRFTQWDYLEKYCGEIYQKQVPNPEIKALRAICLMEVNRDVDSSKYLQEAMAEGPKDPYVLITQAAYLAKVGRLPEANTILKMPELSTLMVKSLLVGDICMSNQDVSCAQRAFSQVYSQDNQNASALFGLGWVAMNKNDRVAAYGYVRAGLQSEPLYLPLLELRDQLEYE
ncbi:MAG: tetratricopeptide repeat protein [Bdellovibrio sp.]